ncbi:hypothetical protein FC83_GL001566 [Agrilactobacillus composti DSM 18527 = JCM 14202]|uniref:Uncharacterized protein n=1 Tax=Agrilactobacillus composti DSM 18527 = JCM 14202 TaxID=1423734 RepID=X0PMZ0_9LACO|nr:hypothetical protein [Agrilactobacillus composti]KRM30435.1 hypothetical protein FC83_GL001566 [Agrilactobacillus composti DSM 18527 = JCM 14202]GAF38912.1 hypothetical protein JCM14202_743 [Agrilactobacillus composti DSM 18527 = JCM 14202]
MIAKKESVTDEFLDVIHAKVLKEYALEDIQTRWTECLDDMKNLYKQSQKIMVHIRGGLTFKDTNRILKGVAQNSIPFKVYGRKYLDREAACEGCIAVVVSVNK